MNAMRITQLLATLERDYDMDGDLDLAIAVADANFWARIYRLAGLKPELFYLHIA